MNKSLTALVLLVLLAGPALAQSPSSDPVASELNTSSNYAPGQVPKAENETLNGKAIQNNLNTSSNYAPRQTPKAENEVLDEKATMSNLNTSSSFAR